MNGLFKLTVHVRRAPRPVCSGSGAMTRSPGRSAFIRRLLLAGLVGSLLAACGGGDSESGTVAREPVPIYVQRGTEDPQASTAQALPPPEPADAPVLQAAPPATRDEPPSRAPTAQSTSAARAAAARLPTPSVLRQTVVTALASPTDMAFTSDGLLFYTERQRGLSVQRPARAGVALVSPHELATVGPLEMIGVAVDPDFARHRFVYVLARSRAGGAEDLRVIRLRVDDAVSKVLDRRDILVVATAARARATGNGDEPAGGVLRFGPDGHLYVGMVDGEAAASARLPQGWPGQVLRIDRDGKAAPGHRPPAGIDGRVFAQGLREPVALAFHPATQTLLVGQRHAAQPDALTWVQPGADAGRKVRCTGAAAGDCGAGGAAAAPAPHGWQGAAPGEGLAAVELLRSPMWREWRNAFALAFDAGRRIDFVQFDAAGRVVQAAPVVERLGVGFRAVAQGPDGLYVMTSGKAGGDEIWRLLAH